MLLLKDPTDVNSEIKESFDIIQLQNENHDLLCINCDNFITNSKYLISIEDKYEHTFINPEGFWFTILCFSQAQGVLEIGSPSEQFTWFPGHSWTIGKCSECSAHLGWTFKGKSYFTGLIQNTLHLK